MLTTQGQLTTINFREGHLILKHFTPLTIVLSWVYFYIVRILTTYYICISTNVCLSTCLNPLQVLLLLKECVGCATQTDTRELLKSSVDQY